MPPSQSLYRLLIGALENVAAFKSQEEEIVEMLATAISLNERITHLTSLHDNHESLPGPLALITDLQPRLLLAHTQQLTLIRKYIHSSISELDELFASLERANAQAKDTCDSLTQFDTDKSSVSSLFDASLSSAQALPIEYLSVLHELCTAHSEQLAQHHSCLATWSTGILDDNIIKRWNSVHKHSVIDYKFIASINARFKRVKQ